MSRPCQRERRSPKSGQPSSSALASSMRTNASKETNASSWCSTPGGMSKARQERLRVAAELPHQVGVAPQVGGTDQAAHAINSLCREMTKVCRKVSRPATRLDHPVYNVLRHSRQEARGSHDAQHFDVLIIGAGLSGIGTACQVTGRAPGQDHRRPGAPRAPRRHLGPVPLPRHPLGLRHVHLRLQVPAVARAARCSPTARRSAQYIADTAAEYGIDEKIHYGLKIVTADWSSAESRWTVTALHEATGETRTYTCGFLISCTGYYNYDAGLPAELPRRRRSSRASASTRSTGPRTSTTPARRSS